MGVKWHTVWKIGIIMCIHSLGGSWLYDNKPVWPTWTVGTPSIYRDARRIHTNRICFHMTPPSLRSRDILVMGRKPQYVDTFLKDLGS